MVRALKARGCTHAQAAGRSIQGTGQAGASKIVHSLWLVPLTLHAHSKHCRSPSAPPGHGVTWCSPTRRLPPPLGHLCPLPPGWRSARALISQAPARCDFFVSTSLRQFVCCIMLATSLGMGAGSLVAWDAEALCRGCPTRAHLPASLCCLMVINPS